MATAMFAPSQYANFWPASPSPAHSYGCTAPVPRPQKRSFDVDEHDRERVLASKRLRQDNEYTCMLPISGGTYSSTNSAVSHGVHVPGPGTGADDSRRVWRQPEHCGSKPSTDDCNWRQSPSSYPGTASSTRPTLYDLSTGEELNLSVIDKYENDTVNFGNDESNYPRPAHPKLLEYCSQDDQAEAKAQKYESTVSPVGLLRQTLMAPVEDWMSRVRDAENETEKKGKELIVYSSNSRFTEVDEEGDVVMD
ncbi:hypothetical protein SAICODRAFT_29553 [Saitoella complicata NRRL Y-17804]|uniref:uncharacterized protein n=1 Tax=Saitoella complicata (strain BCRC 22490 / CBS 7301 / JCM 7358 / NBRC 10748 / NRRL Y-17804) TaxID=698492 RepID=UPI000867ED7E|nr:uncharacterized protein SAICODRAFT_29553 [Saitoella complicata NRRL Y-17804]ODQ54442.1 hypothetical protein SAICODRAFT_29553 [Saitoella complicata NRRL Y-17804]